MKMLKNISVTRPNKDISAFLQYTNDKYTTEFLKKYKYLCTIEVKNEYCEGNIILTNIFEPYKSKFHINMLKNPLVLLLFSTLYNNFYINNLQNPRNLKFCIAISKFFNNFA